MWATPRRPSGSNVSGILAPALSAVQALLGFTLRPASFRGVPFYTQDSSGRGGRRLVIHQFPLRDDAYTEDLGRLPRVFRLTCYVVGFNYQAQRDALLSAVEDQPGPATLVHYTMGEISAAAGVVEFNEHRDAGGYCSLEIEFVRAGPAASPTGTADTASALLAGVASALALVSAAYGAITLAAVSPLALLENAGAAMLGLPAETVTGLSAQIAAVAAQPTDPSATAGAVQTATQGMATAAIAVQTITPAPDDPVAGTLFTIAVPADPSGGLISLATWGATLPAVGGVGPQASAQAAQQAAVLMLVQGNATAALAQVYGSIDWPYADAADAARTQLLGLLDAQALAAADAGQDDLWRAWSALTVLAMDDMIVRAQGLPTLGSYTTGEPLPSVVLAQMLYLDPGRAGELEDLNDVPHPLFMPVAGLALSA